MTKPNHHSLAYKKQANPNKTFKELTQKQKLRIADWMYGETFRFYVGNNKMPNESECESICRLIYNKIENAAIWVPYDDVLRIFLSRQERYAARILADMEHRASAESFSKSNKPAKPERIPKNRPKKRKGKKVEAESWQDDRFFFIAGYTSGGAPYGLTREEMGLEPWQELNESE